MALRMIIRTATTAAAGAGVVISFLVAVAVARAQLSALGAGSILMQLAPVCAGGGVLGGWYWGAELAGIRSETTGVAKLAESMMCFAQGALIVATCTPMLAQLGAMSAHQRVLLLAIVVAWTLPIPFGFVWAGGSFMRRSKEAERV